jgi:hypothetical protein
MLATLVARWASVRSSMELIDLPFMAPAPGLNHGHKLGIVCAGTFDPDHSLRSAARFSYRRGAEGCSAVEASVDGANVRPVVRGDKA